MSVTTIGDCRIRVKASNKLLQVIDTHKHEFSETTENIAKLLKTNGYSLPTKIETLTSESIKQQSLIDLKLIKNLNDGSLDLIKEATAIDTAPQKQVKISEFNRDDETENVYLYLEDLRWLNIFFANLRKEQMLDLYLHHFLEKSTVILPENEIIERNPELEARCEKLRLEQQNRDYFKMTKNVDAVLKNYPEDTVAYQMKALNKQIIAVFQFVLSVVAGFVFGFLGLELIFGGLDFGLRLLMGIMFALIIALAEIYFLAKKLNEYDVATNDYNQSPTKNRKVHSD